MQTLPFPLQVITAALLACASGCTHMMHAPKEVVSNYSVADKVNLKAAVAVLPELANAKWEFHYLGDTWLLPLGENLKRNAENMAKQLFKSVTVQDVMADNALPGADVTLIPKMKAFEQSSGPIAWSEAVTTIILEWSLKDARNNIVWANTIRADARGKLGTAFSQKANDEKRTKEAIETVFRNSFDAISKSPEVRKLAAGP